MAHTHALERLCLMALLPGVFSTACDGGSSTQAGGDPPPVVRPGSVETLDVDLSQQTLPGGLDAASMVLASDPVLGTLAGGSGGLFVQGSGGFESIDDTPVTSMVALDGVGILIGRGDGLRIWDGRLNATSLDDALGGEGVTALASTGTAAWIATDTTLFKADGELTAFEALGGATSIATFTGSRDVLLTFSGGRLSLLRADGDGWTVQSLDGEPVEMALPGQGGRILGLDAGALVERVSVDSGAVAWRPVALTTDTSDAGAEALEALAVDPDSGALWVVGPDTLSRIEGDAIATADKPLGLGVVTAAFAVRGGALWLSDGTGMWSAQGDGQTITFETHIAGFGEENCARCHGDDGIAHPIITHDHWVAEADSILEQLDTLAMPADGRPLIGGSADLVRRWIEDGLKP